MDIDVVGVEGTAGVHIEEVWTRHGLWGVAALEDSRAIDGGVVLHQQGGRAS